MRKGGPSTFVQGYDGERPKEGEGVGSEAASILHHEGDQDVRASVDRNDGLGSSHVCIELHVLGLLGCILSRERGCSLKDGVAVYCCYHNISHYMHVLCKKFQDDHVSGPRRI